MVDIGVPRGAKIAIRRRSFASRSITLGMLLAARARWMGDRWRSFGHPPTVLPPSGITRPTLTTATAPTRSTTWIR